MRLIASVPNAMIPYAKKLSLFLFLPLLEGTFCLNADENLTHYINSLEQRIQHLEKEKKSKGLIQLGSADTTMFLGGTVSLDTIYLHTANGETGGNNSSDQFFNANNIPIDQKGEDSELSLTARNSKFWVKTRTAQVNDKPLRTLLEIDFWGSNGNETNSNSHNLRLRHAYIIYNGWTLGQTNSLFVGTSKPHTLLSPVDDVFMRQALISYKKQFKKNRLALSFEQAESVIMTSIGEKITVNDDRLPDMVVQYAYYNNRNDLSLSLLARELRIEQENGIPITDSTFGYGINFNNTVHTYKNNTLTFGLVGGKGIGRYMATSFFPSATLTPEQQLKAQQSWGMHLGYEHWINHQLRLNMAAGKIETHPILTLDTIDKSAWSGHLGLQYNPLKKFFLGLEYIHGERELQNHKKYAVDRLYLRTSYDF
ncbi:hypothetical protein KKC13_06250 [bacterium]|nr:hypothetical protein [bacterium]MBU1958996.1 hypothetical protein [bacterium]